MSKLKYDDINNLWIDDNNNSWDALAYSEDDATKLSETLVNCVDCYNCSHCNDCTKCNSSSGLSSCKNCFSCNNCSQCGTCYYCEGCTLSYYCFDCIDCYNCYKLWGFKSAKKHIFRKIEKQKENVVFFWDSEKAIVLYDNHMYLIKNFEQKILNIHQNNEEYISKYLKLIKRIKKLIEKK